ncbi:hypothetical protein ACTFIY_009146 [Dictyostelium cf. discoideum]
MSFKCEDDKTLLKCSNYDYKDRCAITVVEFVRRSDETNSLSPNRKDNSITYDTMYVDKNNLLFKNVEPVLRIMQSSANWKRSSWLDVIRRRDEDLHGVASFSEDLVSSALDKLFHLSHLHTSQRNSRVKRAEGLVEKHENNISKEFLTNL